MQAPRIGEGINLRMCRNCGMSHPRSADCISVLRDRIAVLEFKVGSEQGRQQSQCKAELKAAGARLGRPAKAQAVGGARVLDGV